MSTWTDLPQLDRERVLGIQRTRAETGEARMLSVGAGMRRIRRLLASATPAQWAHGETWYLFAHHLAAYLARRHGYDTGQVARVMAALSPSSRWHVVTGTGNVSGNIADTVAILESPDVRTPVNASPLQRERAIAVLRGEADVRLGRDKVRSFADNIAYPETSRAVTVDIWMLRALTGGAQTGAQFDAYLGSSYSYAYHAEPIVRVADSIGLLPLQVQAIVWGVIRERGK